MRPVAPSRVERRRVKFIRCTDLCRAPLPSAGCPGARVRGGADAAANFICAAELICKVSLAQPESQRRVHPIAFCKFRESNPNSVLVRRLAGG
jgi:hypothetical protein